MMMAMIWKKNLLLVLGVSVSLLGINNAESESSSGGLDTVNISLEVQIDRLSDKQKSNKTHLIFYTQTHTDAKTETQKQTYSWTNPWRNDFQGSLGMTRQGSQEEPPCPTIWK